MQAAQPLGDKQAQVAALHERTRDIMDKLRETLRDEHSFSFQVRARRIEGSWISCCQTAQTTFGPCVGRLRFVTFSMLRMRWERALPQVGFLLLCQLRRRLARSPAAHYMPRLVCTRLFSHSSVFSIDWWQERICVIRSEQYLQTSFISM